ncbi:TerB family tellurite resistance protein [Embleya sp. NBC_00896]|uniref:TerB family tellurite resistance protein n=1 Tax=Embleya sp. NBC_00896 TaxID=2975961 RepID=UPI00386E32CF|nr:TerB family tellurite resistance protein [Embleya sp. NBC_00896]
MFVFVGIRTIRSAIGDGEFHCPACGGDRRFRKGGGRRRLVVFGVALIPLGRAGSGIECAVCCTRHDIAVLEPPTARALTLMLREAVRSLVVAVVAAVDDEPHAADTVRAAAVEAVRAAGMPSYDACTLAADVGAHQPQDTAWALAEIAPHLAVAGREHLVGVAARVALACGAYDPAHRVILYHAGDQLGLGRARVDHVLAGP